MLDTHVARHLSDTVGPDWFLDTPAACAAFAVRGVAPQFVIAPGTLAELCDVMAVAAAARFVVAPWGGGSRQSYGGPLRLGERPLLVVRTHRLNRVLHYEPADLTISVEAGMTPAALAELAAAHNQMLPLDTALLARSTIGGLLASAADGPRRLGYGTARDLLIGMQVVEASGRSSKAGGMTVKNVSGYDMMKLYLGSLGTLAIIASANFKLLPLPRAAATIWCAFARHAEAMALVDALHASQLTPAAVEYLAGVDPGPDAAPAPVAVAVLAEGLPAAVERHTRDVPKLAAQAGAAQVQVIAGTAHQALWARINDLPQTAAPSPGELVLKLACLPAELGQALQVAAELAERHGLALLVDARALNGVAYLRLRAADGSADLTAWYAAMAGRWPHLSVLAGADTIGVAVAPWGCAPAGLALMQRIKREFDPHEMLNPGRFVV